MAKKKKSSGEELKIAKITLAAAILNLITSILVLLDMVLRMIN